MSFDTPILFTNFNRPELTARNLEAIRRVKPSKLFIVVDGARETRAGEDEKVRQVKAVLESIDWPCDVHKRYREENWGCKRSMSDAITWFFENVEAGIILEDDCVPDESFFWFCHKMLDHYANEERVMMISGTNFIDGKAEVKDSYFFSNYYNIWGWATWRRAWEKYDVKMAKWNEYKNSGKLAELVDHPKLIQYYTNMFNHIEKGFDTWDIQWWFACIFNRGLAIVPKTNLISNIGLEGTHSATQGDDFIGLSVEPIDYKNIRHPSRIEVNELLNKITYKYSHAHQDIFDNVEISSKDILFKTPEDVPVLMLVFNRPHFTKEVFAVVRRQKPKKLYIAADGPRPDHPSDIELCRQTREVFDNVDWNCEVKTLFRKSNKGLKIAVSDAISWFFDNEPAGMILEDDCVPTPSFFRFCMQMLNKYQYDERVMAINGYNFQDGQKRSDSSYYFSAYAHVWGWATWRRAWSLYDINMYKWEEFKQYGLIKNVTTNARESEFWLDVMQRTKEGKITSWDYQWIFALFYNSGLSVVPEVSLVRNLGLAGGTNDIYKGKSISKFITGELEEIKFADNVARNYLADHYEMQTYMPLKRYLLIGSDSYLREIARKIIPLNLRRLIR